MRNRKTSEEIFFDDIYHSIKRLFIDDPNYKSGYHGYTPQIIKLEEATISKAEYLLEHMDKIKHLIVNDYD